MLNASVCREKWRKIEDERRLSLAGGWDRSVLVGSRRKMLIRLAAWGQTTEAWWSLSAQRARIILFRAQRALFNI